jgi:hypothetical protein
MIIMKKNEIVYFSFKDETTKKNLAKLLLIIIVVGYILLAGITALMSFSVVELRVIPEDFETTSPDNETIALTGSFLVENDHWYSVDITDLKIEFTLSTDNGTEITTALIEKDAIPRMTNTKVSFDLEFDLLEIGLEKFIALNETESLELGLNIGFVYWLAPITLQITTQVNL